MTEPLDSIVAQVVESHRNGTLTGLALVMSQKGGGIKYRYSDYVRTHPSNFIGYLSAICAELVALLMSRHK